MLRGCMDYSRSSVSVQFGSLHLVFFFDDSVGIVPCDYCIQWLSSIYQNAFTEIHSRLQFSYFKIAKRQKFRKREMARFRHATHIPSVHVITDAMYGRQDKRSRQIRDVVFPWV